MRNFARELLTDEICCGIDDHSTSEIAVKELPLRKLIPYLAAASSFFLYPITLYKGDYPARPQQLLGLSDATVFFLGAAGILLGFLSLYLAAKSAEFRLTQFQSGVIGVAGLVHIANFLAFWNSYPLEFLKTHTEYGKLVTIIQPVPTFSVACGIAGFSLVAAAGLLLKKNSGYIPDRYTI